MNLNITGHHVEVTPAIRDYVTSKLDRVIRHFDNVTSVGVILSVEKLRQKAEVTVHVRGKDIHVESEDSDMYAAIDALTDKLDRQVPEVQDQGGRPRPRLPQEPRCRILIRPHRNTVIPRDRCGYNAPQLTQRLRRLPPRFSIAAFSPETSFGRPSRQSPSMNLIAKLLPPANVVVGLEASSKKRAFEQAGLLFENNHGIGRGTVFDSLFARGNSAPPAWARASRFPRPHQGPQGRAGSLHPPRRARCPSTPRRPSGDHAVRAAGARTGQRTPPATVVRAGPDVQRPRLPRAADERPGQPRGSCPLRWMGKRCVRQR